MAKKQPRDFVFVDDLWPADDGWKCAFPGQKIWVFMDEYHATLPGDMDYRRVIMSGGDGLGWIYQLPLGEKEKVSDILNQIKFPVSQNQLSELGFVTWQEHETLS